MKSNNSTIQYNLSSGIHLLKHAHTGSEGSAVAQYTHINQWLRQDHISYYTQELPGCPPTRRLPQWLCQRVGMKEGLIQGSGGCFLFEA